MRARGQLQDVQTYGRPLPVLRGCYNPAPSDRATRRIAQVTDANSVLAQRDAGRSSNARLSAGGGRGGGGGARGSVASSGARVW